MTNGERASCVSDNLENEPFRGIIKISQIKLKYKLQVKENSHAYKETISPLETH